MGRKFLRWSLKDLAEVINRRVNNEFDCNILIEGKRGLGKSSLAYKLANLSKLKFKPKRDLLYSRDEVLKAITNYRKGVILADELVNVGYKRDFYEHGQKQLIKALNMYRDSNNLFFGCIPRFVDIDTDLMGLCQIRLTVIRRGVAIIHRPVSSTYTRDPWDIKNNAKIESTWTMTRSRKPRFMKLTTCIGYIRYGALGPASWKIYESIKHDKRGKVYMNDEEAERLSDPNFKFYHNLKERMIANKLTPDILMEICQVSGKSYKGVRSKLNEMLREEGKNRSVKDFINFNNMVSKLDPLGFTKTPKGD